jgi:hypothetical protein
MSLERRQARNRQRRADVVHGCAELAEQQRRIARRARDDRKRPYAELLRGPEDHRRRSFRETPDLGVGDHADDREPLAVGRLVSEPAADGSVAPVRTGGGFVHDDGRLRVRAIARRERAAGHQRNAIVAK